MATDISDTVRALHARDGPRLNVFVANVVTAFLLLGLIVASLVLLIVNGGDAKAIVDFLTSVVFFVAVLLLIVGELYADNSTASVLR